MILPLLMRFPLLSLLLFAVPGSPDAPGTVLGQVSLLRAGAPQPDAANAVVWIQGARRGKDAPPPPPATMKSDQKRFAPRVVAVSRAGAVAFPNADPIYHNVFSVSGGNRFDLGLYRSGASKSREFDEAGLVRVYCNIHPQMVGFVMVVDSDFFAVTGRDGKFRFDGVPSGDWTLKAWHEEASEQASQPLRVPLRPDAPVTIRLDASGYKPEPHKNKYGREYPPQPPSDDERY